VRGSAADLVGRRNGGSPLEQTMEAVMLREQMINFLEAAVVFLLATNAASALAALYAMRLANAVSAVPKTKSAVVRRIEAMVSRPR
jgi:hypothetical protein